MAHLGKSRSRRQWIVITVIVIAIAVIVIWWVAAARQVTGMATDLPADLPTTADRSIVASTDVEYPTLDALTASSDFVVKGSVVGVTQGGTWTFADDSGVPASGQTDRLLRIQVEETVFSATGDDAPAEIFVLEGIWEAKVGIQHQAMPWAQPGERGYFYVKDYPEYGDEQTFNYVDVAGRVLIREDRAIVADHHQRVWAPVHDEPASGTPEFSLDPDSPDQSSAALSRVETLIGRAAGAADSGAAKPIELPRPDPCPPTAQCPEFSPADRGE